MVEGAGVALSVEECRRNFDKGVQAYKLAVEAASQQRQMVKGLEIDVKYIESEPYINGHASGSNDAQRKASALAWLRTNPNYIQLSRSLAENEAKLERIQADIVEAEQTMRIARLEMEYAIAQKNYEASLNGRDGRNA